MLKTWQTKGIAKKAADLFGILVILSGIGVSIYMNTVGRSLWLDEAYLVSSLKNRSLLRLTASPLDYIQSAPIIYLYIVKILMMVFGDSEGVLRLFSIISYGAAIVLTYYVSKKLFRCKYPVLCAAFVANIDFLLRYSNVLKPYVSECVWVLLVFIVYYLYEEKRITWYAMAVCYMVFIWAANPVCFFIGGVLTCEFVTGIFQKEGKRVIHSIVSGVGILTSFVVYYFYWLRSAATDDFMQNYWLNDRFPLFPINGENLKTAWKLIRRLFGSCHDELRFLLAALVLGALLAGIWKKNKYCVVAAIGFALSLVASSLYMFPIADRLWCFSFPLFAVLAFYFIDMMLVQNGSRRGELFALFLMILLIWTNSGILTYRNAEEVYWKGNEANPLIAYVQETIQEGEKVYVFYNSIPVVTYKNGYGVNKIGNVEEDNILWGTSVLADADADMILQEERCYILTSQADEETIGTLLDILGENGSVETVLDVYDTRLYLFSR